jgi:hypothetical protein
MRSRRFSSPAHDFDLDVLVGRLRRGFVLSVGLAALLHLVVVGINPFKTVEQKAPRPLSTKFIKRQPRLTKPLELRKIPQPKRQLARREVQLAKARMDQVQATASFNTRSLIASHVGGSGISLAGQANFGAMSSMNLEPKLAPSKVTSMRTSEYKIDLNLEMVDINNMDTGRYQAMVIQDPSDKQAVKGFVRLAQVMSAGATLSDLNTYRLDRLCDAINEYTGLRAEFVGSVTFADDRLLDFAIIMPHSDPNESEMANIARYLLAGGFIFASSGEALNSHLWGEALEKYGGLVHGQDFWSERLVEDHPIYTAFFDIIGGVPYGYYTGITKAGVRGGNFMTGHFIKGRLAGVTPGSGGWGWTTTYLDGSLQRQLQMAVNIAVYALTQEGSITQRLMQVVH